MKRIYIISALALLCLSSCTKAPSPTFHRPGSADPAVDTTGAFSVRVGEPLPAWQEGVLDIHAINSARGECTFFILPDGTTLVVDAGDMYGYTNASYANVTPKPDAATEPYKVYGAYIQKYMPKGHNYLDYMLLTHYHTDHFGYKGKGDGRTTDSQGGYTLMGVSGLYSIVPFTKIIDRSYPDYTGCIEPESTSTELPEYASFVDYSTKNRSLSAEKFDVGSTKQIALKYNPSKYDFSILNLAASGQVWDGTAVQNLNPEKKLAENALSCAFLLRYGKFEYFTSGDLNDNSCCQLMARTVGHEIEAEKCLHHMTNASPYAVQYQVFKSRVVVTQSFYVRTIQPAQSMVSLYSASQDLFFTNIDQSLLDANPEVYQNCKGINGHVVIRVTADTGNFYVYLLDDTGYDCKVKGIYGPYSCK